MRDKNGTLGGRLIGKNITRFEHEIRNKFKVRLRELESNRSQMCKATSSQTISKSKVHIQIDETPPYFNLQQQAMCAPKVFSDFFIRKMGEINTKNAVHAQSSEGSPREASPKSIRESLQQKITENVKLHKLEEKLPKIKKAVQKQDVRKEEPSSFRVKLRKEKQEVCFSAHLLSLSRLKHRRLKTEAIHEEQQKELHPQARVTFTRQFKPWAEIKHVIEGI